MAFMVTAAHGLDASQYTFNYVAGWAHQASTPNGPSVEEIVKATGQRVIGATDRILLTTQPAPTVVDEALADLAVEVGRPGTAVTPSPQTAADVDSARSARVHHTPTAAERTVAPRRVSPWERVTTPVLDGAVRGRQAAQLLSVAPAPAPRR